MHTLCKFFTVLLPVLAVQCERKPITKCVENGSNENYLPNLSAQSLNHLVHQEKLESEPLMPSSASSLPSTSANSSQNPQIATFLTEEHYDSIISTEHLQFKLKPPAFGASSLSMEYVYEIATRLLFLTVDWARSIQAFRSLENTDQLVLLQSTWTDLFLLGVAQCSSCFPLSPLLTLAAASIEKNDAKDSSPNHKSTAVNKEPSVLDTIMSVKELVFSLEKLELDSVEYALLKAIVLFNSGTFVM